MTDIPPPFMVSYGITSKCNLNCKHCYAQATEEASSDEPTCRLRPRGGGYGYPPYEMSVMFNEAPMVVCFYVFLMFYETDCWLSSML